MSALVAICVSLHAIHSPCHCLAHIWSLRLLLLRNCWRFHNRWCWWFSHRWCSLVYLFVAISTLLLLKTCCCEVTIVLLSMLRYKLLIVKVMWVGQLSLRLVLSCLLLLLLLLLLLVILKQRTHATLCTCRGMCLLHNASKLMSHHIWNVV